MEENKLNSFAGELTDEDAAKENASLSSETLAEVTGASGVDSGTRVPEDKPEEMILSGKRYGEQYHRAVSAVESIKADVSSSAKDLIDKAQMRYKDILESNDK